MLDCGARGQMRERRSIPSLEYPVPLVVAIELVEVKYGRSPRYVLVHDHGRSVGGHVE